MTPKECLRTVLDEEHVTGILDHRKAIRKPLTERAAMLLAKELQKTGDPNAAADEILLRGWRGFKADWMQRSSMRSTQPQMTNLDRLEQDLAERIRNGTRSQGSLDLASVPRLSGR